MKNEFEEVRLKIDKNTKEIFKLWKEDDKIKRLDRYKMNMKDFNLWLKYLGTHPRNPNYVDFKKFKEKVVAQV